MYYFIKINLGLVLSVLFYKLVSLGLWFFPYLLYGSSLIIPASAFLHFVTVNCAATSLDGSQCITTTSVYVLTFMFVLLIFLILLYLNNRYLNNGVKSSKIVLFLTAAMFLFNIGGVVELGQSLIQVYENRLGSFDQNLNQKHDYVSFLDFSINIPRDWISIDDNTTQYVRLIPKRLIGEHQKISAIVIGPSGTSPSFPASVYQILSGGRENVFCDGGRFKEILFAGRTAVECVSINKYESIRIIRILDTSGLSNWKKNNFIFYNLQEPHLNLTSLYNKVLNTITFN